MVNGWEAMRQKRMKKDSEDVEVASRNFFLEDRKRGSNSGGMV
jgi:hypothetical protein